MKITHLLASALLASFLFFGLVTPAAAQSGGGGGGGGGANSGGSGGGSSVRHGGSFKLFFDQSSTPAGALSTCTGGYNLSTYVTTLTLDYKCSNLELADGTQIYAYVYTTDYFTGLPWLPIYAGASSVLRGKAAFNNPNVYTTGFNGLPVMRTVQLSLADGTVIFTGHP